MDGKEIAAALEQLERERNIPAGKLVEALERGLVSAYKGKNKCPDADVHADINTKTGAIELYLYRNVVEEVEDPWLEVAIEELNQYEELKGTVSIGDKSATPLDFENLDLGRIAAQTAKQIVVGEVRDIERGMVYDEYIDRVGELVTGTVQRVSNDTVFVNLGRTEGLLAPGEQVRNERYVVNARLRYYILEVRKSQKGPQVFLSRSHPGLVKRLFELEVPEIADGIVTIESVAREGGSRTKMAVLSSEESVDPVGACVGTRGVRVQAVVDELFGEKIDIIAWSDNKEANIMSALSPSKVEKIIEGEEENEVTAVVPDYQLSLAIGKEGQNVRLAAKLCGVKIDIKSHSQYYGDAQNAVSFSGELDEEGYLNPDDFMADDAPAAESAEEGDDALAAESAEAPAEEGDDALAAEGVEAPAEEGDDALAAESAEAPAEEGDDALAAEGVEAPAEEGDDALAAEGDDLPEEDRDEAAADSAAGSDEAPVAEGDEAAAKAEDTAETEENTEVKDEE
jgi:N utilization substance protein A